MVAVRRAGRKVSDKAATWRDSSGQVEATADPATMCWYPRRPGRLRAVDAGDARALRCRACPGCYELEMRELAERLHLKYANSTALLYYAWIPAPADDQAGRNHNFHRRAGLQLESGLLRNGRTSIALLSERKRPLEVLRRELKADFHIQYISVKRGIVAFRPLAQGLLVSRRTYGEQVKRFYIRRLPKLERRSFTIDRIPYEKGYDVRSGPRAWRADGRALFPPEIWRLQNRDRRRVRNLLALAPNGECVQAVMKLVTAVAAGSSLTLNQPTRPILPADAVQRHYLEHAMRVKARDDAARAATTVLSSRSSGEGATQVLDTIDSNDGSKLLSDVDLARAGPSGRPAWQERDLRDQEIRRAARPLAPKSTPEEWKAWGEKMSALVKNRSTK